MSLKNKRVLVTGADGFIGSHIIDTLLSEGCHIKAFVYYNSFNSWGWLDSFSKEKLESINIITGDIRDSEGVRTAIEGVDIVFHLAALIGIPYSYYSPDSYVETNIKGVLNVLHACRSCGVEKIITTSTSEVYGTAQYTPIDENHPLKPQSPYSATKIGADAIAESFYLSFKIPLVIARPFNTYGPRQSARAVIPTIITQLLNGYKQIKLGSLYPTRDLNYVHDVCNGFIALAECNEAIGRVVNIGSGSEIAVGELAKMIIRLIDIEAEIVSDDLRKRPEKSEVERLVCNNTLIKDLTEWRPVVSLEDGLLKTIDWFRDKENLNRYKYDIFNV